MIASKKRWWLFGLFWGAFMFLFQEILFPVSQHEPLAMKGMVTGVLYWGIAGLIFAWILSKVDGGSKATKSSQTENPS
jgi:hypothetical protein